LPWRARAQHFDFATPVRGAQIEPIEREELIWRAFAPDCMAGHIGLEPANPITDHLIGFARQFGLKSSATNFIGSADSLTFKVGSNPKRVTHVRVTLTPDGLYDMTFFRIGKGPQSHDGIHREMLQQVFAANTGHYTALRASA
jgi:hypothetical protein